MIILNNDLSSPLYVQIYEQLKKEIISGQLLEGTKLTSTRNLATTLSVSRNTVESAYLQLSSEGYVSSKVGSGFIVEKLDSTIISKLKKQDYKDIQEHKTISWMKLDKYSNNMVLIGFGGMSESEIIQGIKVLTNAWLLY